MNLYFVFILISIHSQKYICQRLPRGCQETFKNAALKAHNKYRALHGSPAFTKDPSIDLSSLTWSQNLAATDTFHHSESPGLGENLYAFYSSRSLSTRSECAGKYCYSIFFN